MSFVLAISLSSCTEKNSDNTNSDIIENNIITQLYGGEIPCYNVIYENEYDSDDESFEYYDFPVITDNKVSKFEYISFEGTGNGNDNIICNPSEFKPELDVVYNNYHVNYFHLNIGVNTSNPVNANITSFKIKLNGQAFDYKIDHMTIKNIKGAFGEEYSIGNDDLKYCTNPILVRQYFSGEAESVGVQAYSDCIVGSYQIEDYVNMNGFKTYINDEEINDIKEIKLKKDDKIAYSYTVCGPDGDYVRPSRISTYILYADKKEIKRYFYHHKGFVQIQAKKQVDCQHFFRQLF